MLALIDVHAMLVTLYPVMASAAQVSTVDIHWLHESYVIVLSNNEFLIRNNIHGIN